MSLQFASLRHEISHHVHAANEPLSAPALLEMCKLAQDKVQVSNCLFAMCRANELQKHPAPEGSGMGVRFLYGPGENKPGAERQENDAGGGDRKAGRAAPKVRRAKHKNRRHKVRKVQRRTAKWQHHRARITPIPAPNPRGDPMWALLADGAFLLLGTEVEIPAHQARALVDFIRTLDKAEA